MLLILVQKTFKAFLFLVYAVVPEYFTDDDDDDDRRLVTDRNQERTT